MARYIDADALFKEFERAAWYNNADRDDVAEEILSQIPTADVVEVVRCKDCKRRIMSNGVYVCNHTLPTKELSQLFITGVDAYAIVEPNDFCSCGERRADND